MSNINTWNKIAKVYEEKFMGMNDYNDSYDIFSQLIKVKNPQLLELGCGPGNITQHLLKKKKKNFTIDATDIAQNMVKLAKKNNPKANCSILDCRKINQLNKSYDGIIAGFCIPYINKSELDNLITNCYSILNDNGVFYLSYIEGDYNQSAIEKSNTGDELFVHYYDKAYVLNKLLANKFSLNELIQQDYIKNDGTNQTLSIFIVSKK